MKHYSGLLAHRFVYYNYYVYMNFNLFTVSTLRYNYNYDYAKHGITLRRFDLRITM